MLKEKNNDFKPCVIGLGYVGLPILLRLIKKFNSIGYDNSKKRILDLQIGKDTFGEVKRKDLTNHKLKFTFNLSKIRDRNLFIITVPTPVFKDKRPDLTHIKDVCLKLSKLIKPNDIIIFESTVYPGLTEKFCIPILEKNNSLKNGKDFFVGYSPERVNPGDEVHKLNKINKILAYPHKFKLKDLIKLYRNLGKKIIYTDSIIEAETAKVIENIQRDVNIGLINEIYMACEALNINFKKVYKLASSKWNFLKFQPGLVGGHCLPVDPYYFSHICIKNNFTTKITLAGRSINDTMSLNIQKKIGKIFKNKNSIKKNKILICGLTYKKNVADIRNSLALKIFKNLSAKNKNIKGYDPIIDKNTSKKYGILNSSSKISKYDIFIILTPHNVLMKKINKLKNKQIFQFFN
tara:strand:+ start:1678 stop:2895 length:1218 start_codon:yes stop_codon:yes gene_type:complete